MKPEAITKSLQYIKSWLPFRAERTDMPGFAVAIAHKGKVILNEAYGYANLEQKEKLTTDYLFRIASHSKTFTATVLMQLAEQGKLLLDDHLTDYLPWLKQHRDKRFQNITLRQVMSHGAGIIRDGLDQDYWQLMDSFPTEDELKKAVLAADLVIENNTKLKYSNFGYSLLGLVIEAVSGEPYNRYVTRHIIEPLKLQNTGPEYDSTIEKRLVTGYSREEIGHARLSMPKTIDTHAMSPATGFYATAADLCTYFSAHIVGSGTLLSDESKKEMQRPVWSAEHTREKEEYALGLEIEEVQHHHVFGHSGGFPGHVTKSMCDPKNELVVVALTNCINGQARSITRGILSIFYYFNRHLASHSTKTELNMFEGRFISMWSMLDIVAVGNHIIGAYPDTWYPFIKPEELEYINSTTLRIAKTNSFLNEGELIHFKFNRSGQIILVNYAGLTMWPSDIYFKRQARKITQQ